MNSYFETLDKMEDCKNEMESQKEEASHAPDDVNDKSDGFLNIPDADAICEELPLN